MGRAEVFSRHTARCAKGSWSASRRRFHSTPPARRPETTLTSMMLPLLPPRQLIVGLPYTLAEVNHTASGGTPYGASHWAGPADDKPLTDDERALCIALGKRLAETASKLSR